MDVCTLLLVVVSSAQLLPTRYSSVVCLISMETPPTKHHLLGIEDSMYWLEGYIIFL